MRFPEPRTKAAIQHAEQEVRLLELGYYADSYARDESVMPLVMQAVETNGIDDSFKVLRDAERLPQTIQTIDWLITQLGRDDLDLKKICHDNDRFAIGLIAENF